MTTDMTEFRAAVLAANPFVPGPHQPNDNERWQESVFMIWHDLENGVGGMQRVGFEPNAGTSNQQTAAYTTKGVRFRQVNHFIPYEDANRSAERFHANGTTSCYFEGDTRWVVDFGEAYRADLQLEDIYPYTPLYAAEEGKARDWAVDPSDAGAFLPAHWEASSRITGEVTLAGERYDVNGFAHRDQSYGFRDWTIIRSHRAMVGTFGPEFNFSVLIWHTSTDAYAGYGFLMRDGVEEWTSDVDIVVQMAPDGLTVHGGVCTLKMPSGEVLTINAVAHASIMLPNYEYFGVDTNCVISCGEFEHGFADLEVSNNPFDGRRYPTFSTGTTLENGLFLP